MHASVTSRMLEGENPQHSKENNDLHALEEDDLELWKNK